MASTLGLDPDHRSDRGTSPKTTTVSPERERERETVPESLEEHQFVSAVGEPRCI